MRGQLHSELLKIRSIRTMAVFLLAAVALTLLGVLSEGFSGDVAELAAEDAQRALIGDYGASNVVLLSAFLGLLLVTSEFRYGTIRPTLLFEPRRRVFLAAKLVAASLTAILFAAVCVVLCFASAFVVFAVRDIDWALTSTHILVLVVGPVAASALAALLGVTIGALIRNQVGAILALAVYAVAFESLLFAVAPSLGRYSPAQAASSLGGMPDDYLLAPGAGAMVLIAWVVAFTAAATLRMNRSDV
jgi:ABC-type transport system involved in multi-copper enzyme maturation permease subunit